MKLKTLALAAGLACATGAIAAPTQWTSASGGNSDSHNVGWSPTVRNIDGSDPY